MSSAESLIRIIVSLRELDRIVVHEGEFMRLGSRATELVRMTNTRRSEGWMPVKNKVWQFS